MKKTTLFFFLFIWLDINQAGSIEFADASINSMCYSFKQTFECFRDQIMDAFNNEGVNIIEVTFDSAFFQPVQKRLRVLRIDLGPLYNERVKIKIDRAAFWHTINLNELSLIKFVNLNQLPDLDPVNKLIRLTVHKSNLRSLPPNFCLTKPLLEYLSLAYNELENLSHVLDECHKLSILDVSNNRIKSLDGVFASESLLARIQLDGNELDELRQSDLYHLDRVIELSVARNKLKHIDETAFDTMTSLTRLELSMNKLKSLPANSKAYPNLAYLNVNENKDLIYFPAADQFSSLKDLQVYYAYHCCAFIGKELTNSIKLDFDQIAQEDSYSIEDIIEAKPIETNLEEFKLFPVMGGQQHPIVTECRPKPDAFMPCENLLETIWLRISVWLISSVGVLANMSAIVYNLAYSWMYYRSTHDLNVPTYLLTHLACADSLMAVYLAFIAIKDLSSRDKFAQSALEWQRSSGCNVAGFLGVVSAVASAFCLAFITFERYYAIKNSTDSNKRITGRMAVLVSIFIWMLAIFLAFLPLAHLKLNSYKSYALCLPFDTRLLGDRIYLIIVNGILSASFFFILACYSLIFTTTLLIERRASQPQGRDGEDSRLARNITLLVVVNLICWAPVVVLSVHALLFSSSQPVMDRSHLKLIAVFVLPFNSLANPFLYCISRRRFRMDLVTGWLNYRFRRNLRTCSSVTSARSVKSSATTRTKNGSI